MKTFTNCAEKKAKQFFNLLQGYTKGIRMTAILILLLMGVGNAWAVNITGGTTLYLELKGGNNGWDKDGARFAAYFCNGTSAAKWYSMPCRNSDGKYYVTVDPGESHKNVIFCRMNGGNQTNDWSNKWNQSGDLTWDGKKNLFVIDNFSDDNWYSYTAPDYTYTIVGNKNIAGSDWNTNDSYNEMTRQDDGTYTLTKHRHSLNAGNYEYKVVRDHNYDCWQCPASGNNTLNIGSNGLYDITFTLNPSTNQLTAVATPTPPTTIYLKLNSKWKQGNERFAVYAFESGEEWFDMSDIGCNGDYYTCTIPAQYPKFILCRMNDGTTSNNWTNKWDQTPDLYVSDTYDNKNLYTLTTNQNDGSWGTLPMYTITTSGEANDGSIVVSPATTVNIGETVTVTIKPNNDYKIKSYTINSTTTNVSETGAKSFDLTICSETTISAEFELSETKYDVTISSAGNGTVEPSGTQKVGASGINITATANTGYQFANWTITGGASVDNANSASTKVTATATGAATAHFTEIKHTITVAPNNVNYGTVAPASVTAGIATGSADIKATPKTGYEFVNWTASSGITLANAKSATTNITKATAAGSVTANFQEKKHDVTVSYKCGTTTIKDNTTTSNVGEVTSTTITAPDDIYGYKFNSWELGSGITQTSVNGNQITITTKSSGDYTLTAKYDEDLNSTWYIAGTTGNGSPFTGWGTSGTKMYKKTGHSTEKKYYCTFEVTTTASSDDQFEFQAYNSSNGSHYGYNSFWITQAKNSTKVYTGNPTNMKFRPYVTGTYEFELDCTGSDPVLTVTWPSYNQIRFYSAGGDEINTYNWENTNTNTWTKEISLTKGTHYFKVLENSEFLGNNGTMTRNSCTSWIMEADKNNCGITADFAGEYLFTYDKSTNKLTITYPTAYTVTYGIGNNKGTDAVTTDPTITSGDLVLASTSITFSKNATKAGYTWKNWNSKADGTGTNLGNSDTYTSTNRTSNITVYACYDLITYNITYNLNGGTGATNTTYNVTTATITLPTPTRTGYTFNGWYFESDFSGTRQTKITQGTTGHKIYYAKWTANTYTITWNANGGTVTPATSTYTYDGAVVEMPRPTRDGYTFNGWYTAANGGTQINNVGKDNKPTSNVTYYAHWTENLNDVIIAYVCGDTHIISSKTLSISEANPAEVSAPEHTGYTFTGWTLGTGITNHSANTTTNPISITTNSTGSGYTLIANYTKNSYTLNFGVQGNIGGSATAIVGGNAITSPATFEHGTKITLTATEDDKYAFIQWVDGSGASLSTANPYTHTLTATTTIQAVFANTDVLYLKPNANWKSDGAWFAAYFFKEGSSDNYWVKMKNENPCGGSDYYKVQIPKGDWTHVIFCRMNSGTSDFGWDDIRWDQSENQEIPTDGNNCFSIDTGEWGGNTGAKGSWSKYTPTNYDPVVFNVTVPAGTPNCYIIGNWDGWSQFTEMTKVDDTHYTVTIYDVCKSTLKYKYCYGPSWGCEEVVSSTDLPTTTIDDRTHKNQDEVKAWIKYCLVGNNNIGWSWNDAYSFDIAGDMSHNFDAKNYDIKVMSSIGKYYTHNEYRYNLHRSHTSVKIPHEGGENNQLILEADIAGNYKFHFDPVSKLLTIEFPEKGYRLKITMEDGTVYTSNAVDNTTETLSFFAPGSDDTELNGTIILEYIGNWTADIPYTSFKTSGVYTAKLNSNNTGITDIEPYDGDYYIRTDGANGGWSNYKTDSDNKMTYFVPREEEKYSYYWVQALPRAPRDHSNGVVNAKACVANDYNDNLAVMLGGDKFTSDADGNIKILDPDEHHREKINVRFGYNPKTNHFERAMLTGSGNINTFLNITDPEGRIYKTNNNGTLETQLIAASKDNKFTDISNWVYERDIWVEVPESEDVTVCLTAVSYNGARNSLFGFIDADQKVPTQRTIVGAGSTQGQKKMRVIYDFKTNRMIMAWMPGDYNCTKEETLYADVLFMRHENDIVPQLNIKDTNTEDQVIPKIVGIQSQFFALEFDKYEKNQLLEEQYWITLPFNCIVGSISGVPGYMQTWGIQRYNGKKRAEKGWWKETETFWEWLDPDDVMEAGVGYVLSFDKSAATWNTFDVHTENSDGSVTTTQRSLLRLYFPSTEEGFTFESKTGFVKRYDNEPCTITTANRHLQDGNWKIIGPISYNSATATPNYDEINVWKPVKDSAHIDVPEGDYAWSAPMFLYAFEQDDSDRSDWKYKVKSTINHTYQAFYGYMVQFAGTIAWSEISQSIHPRLRARTYTDQVPTNITTNLELLDASGRQHDQTFVSLDIEGTTTFDLNKDLNKVFNSNFSNIYTLSENIPFAGNTLPMEKATVPVGVRIATAGEYTFRMPDGTEGIYVTLIDNQTGTQTDMLMSEYTVTLDAGTIENRFYLVVDPDRAATSVENVGEEAKGDKAKGVEKFLIDGKLFIRTADGIFDAKGQRL